MLKRQQVQKTNFNKRALPKPLPELKSGDLVRMWNSQSRNWSTETKIIDKCDSPRLYVVQTQHGHKFHRNRKHLLSPHSTENDLQPPQLQSIDNKSGSMQPISSSNNNEEDKVDNNCEHGPNVPKPVVTRYGRVVKPRQRYIEQC